MVEFTAEISWETLSASMSVSERIASSLIIGLFGLAALACLIWWFSYEPASELYAYVPGLDGGPSLASAESTEESTSFWKQSNLKT
jgi:hypothetical protein